MIKVYNPIYCIYYKCCIRINNHSRTYPTDIFRFFHKIFIIVYNHGIVFYMRNSNAYTNLCVWWTFFFRLGFSYLFLLDLKEEMKHWSISFYTIVLNKWYFVFVITFLFFTFLFMFYFYLLTVIYKLYNCVYKH